MRACTLITRTLVKHKLHACDRLGSMHTFSLHHYASLQHTKKKFSDDPLL
jgi:hypothetical protein